MSRYPAVYRPTSEPESLGNSGGLSGSRLWRFHAGAKMCLARAWPVDGPPLPTLERIHRWLSQAGRLAFVPAPIQTLDGRTLVEHGNSLWEVCPWMDGVADAMESPRLVHLEAAFIGMASFHQALAKDQIQAVSPGIVARLNEVEKWQATGFNTLEQSLAQAPTDARKDLARRWLEAARPVAPQVRAQLQEGSRKVVSLQPCLRDARPDHFLFQGDRLTGLIDFGAMGVDTVAVDLARLLSEWVSHDRRLRRAAMDAYSSIRPLGPDELALIPILEAAASLLIGGRWASWHFLEGREFQDATVVERGLAKGIERVSALTSWS